MADNDRKRHRREAVDGNDVLNKAREIWQREKERALSTEDEDFRTFFGCSVGVFLTLWNLLERFDLLPEGGRIEHLLWTLMFMKLYAYIKALCALAGGVDKNTFMKWTWEFMEAIDLLEPEIVSCSLIIYP